MDQLSLGPLDFAAKKKRTKRDVFLAEMAAVVPWGALEAVIEPHYPKMGPKGGRRAFALGTMLRIYCLQQWYSLSDPGAEEALYDIQSMRAFAGLELGRDAIPDETTILNFRHLLGARADEGGFRGRRRAFRGARRAAARRHDRGCDADRGLAVDEEQATEARPRDAILEEGKPVVFRHAGVDAKSGLVHAAGVTTGSVHDAMMDHLIREDDEVVYGDKGYASDEKKRAAEGAGVLWPVKEKAKSGRKLTKRQQARNRFGKVRAKVEHVFRVMKCQFGYRKVRCRGIAKNGAQVFSLLALANLYLARGRLASA